MVAPELHASIASDESELMSLSPRSARIKKSASAVIGESYECCGAELSGNSITLITAAFLFALITGVQYVFALIANSLALQADCLSMGVDALTYLGNLAVECMPDDDEKNMCSKKGVELAMAGVSYFVLIGFTISFMVEAYETLYPSGDDGGDDDVNGYIVLGFACAGLLFDGASLCVFSQFGERDEEATAIAAGAEDGEEGGSICGINHNMAAALMHVVSDLLRSTTTLVESIVILTTPSIPSDKADGVSALIVCSIIAAGSLAALYSWAIAVHAHLTGSGTQTKPEDRDDAGLQMASEINAGSV